MSDKRLTPQLYEALVEKTANVALGLMFAGATHEAVSAAGAFDHAVLDARDVAVA